MISHGSILLMLAAEDPETLAALRRGFALLSQAAETAQLAAAETDPAREDYREALRASALADARNGWQHLVLAGSD